MDHVDVANFMEIPLSIFKQHEYEKIMKVLGDMLKTGDIHPFLDRLNNIQLD